MGNLEIRQFRNSIVALTNANPLPLEVKRLVFAELLEIIQRETDAEIESERQAKEVSNNEQQ